MNSDQYIVTVFSFKKSKNSKVVPDMESSFNSSVSTNYGPPLDYSFRNISSLEKLERHRPPRQSLRKQVIHWSKSNQSLALQILKLSTVQISNTEYRLIFGKARFYLHLLNTELIRASKKSGVLLGGAVIAYVRSENGKKYSSFQEIKKSTLTNIFQYFTQ